MSNALTALPTPSAIPSAQFRPIRPLRATSSSSLSADMETLASILPRIDGPAPRHAPKAPGGSAPTAAGQDPPPEAPPFLRLAPPPGAPAEHAPAPVAEQTAGVAQIKPPDPSALCCVVVQAAVEALRGLRPLAQLTRWVTPEVYEALARRRHVVTLSNGLSTMQARIRRARVLRISATAAEATVIVQDGDRVRAAAIRVEFLRGNWRVVALELG